MPNPLFAGLALLLVGQYAAANELQRFAFSRVEMGIPFSITLYAADEPTANRAAEAAFTKIHDLNSILSDYDPQSELSRLSNTAGSGEAIQVSPPLWLVLSSSQQLSDRSHGAFDVTVGPLVQLWRRSRKSKELPSPQRLAEARAAVGYKFLRLDDKERTAELLKPRMRLDLGGIGVGYAVDEALAVLKKQGIASAMIDGSGDIGVSDAPPGAKGWRIGIAPLDSPKGSPSHYVSLINAAVTTSGDAFQYVEIAGQRYSHIVDPQSGLGLTQRSSVTIVAADCITADSLATAVSVLGPKAGLELAENTSGVAALIMLAARDGQTEVHASRRLKDYLAPAKSL